MTRQLTLIDEIPFDTIVDYLCLSERRVKQLLSLGQIYNDPREGLIITLDRFPERVVTMEQ